MEGGGPGDAGQVEVPDLVGMIVATPGRRAMRLAGSSSRLFPMNPLSEGSPGPGSGSSPLSNRCPEPGCTAGTTW
jgi:hypothetical protein